jgi:WD40 repeat protein
MLWQWYWRWKRNDSNEGGALVVYDLANGTELRRFDTNVEEIGKLAPSPNGSTIAILGQDARLISAQDGQELAILEGSQGSQADIAFSPDGRSLASIGVDGVLRLLRVEVRSLK